MANKSTQTEMITGSFIELMKNVGTSIPGHILTFDSTTQLAQVQIGILQTDVTGTTHTPAPLVECPVQILGGGEYFVEHQIDKGDECLTVFSQRCIDGWRNTGGVADNPILRFHSRSDACVLMGVRSQANRITNFENNGIRLRDKAGENYVWLKNDGTAEIKVTTLNIVGNVTVTEDVTASGISLVNHGTSPGSFKAGSTPVTGTGGAPT
jgi:hypothetical protein